MKWVLPFSILIVFFIFCSDVNYTPDNYENSLPSTVEVVSSLTNMWATTNYYNRIGYYYSGSYLREFYVSDDPTNIYFAIQIDEDYPYSDIFIAIDNLALDSGVSGYINLEKSPLYIPDNTIEWFIQIVNKTTIKFYRPSESVEYFYQVPSSFIATYTTNSYTYVCFYIPKLAFATNNFVDSQGLISSIDIAVFELREKNLLYDTWGIITSIPSGNSLTNLTTFARINMNTNTYYNASISFGKVIYSFAASDSRAYFYILDPDIQYSDEYIEAFVKGSVDTNTISVYATRYGGYYRGYITLASNTTTNIDNIDAIAVSPGITNTITVIYTDETTPSTNYYVATNSFLMVDDPTPPYSFKHIIVILSNEVNKDKKDFRYYLVGKFVRDSLYPSYFYYYPTYWDAGDRENIPKIPFTNTDVSNVLAADIYIMVSNISCVTYQIWLDTDNDSDTELNEYDFEHFFPDPPTNFSIENSNTLVLYHDAPETFLFTVSKKVTLIVTNITGTEKVYLHSEYFGWDYPHEISWDTTNRIAKYVIYIKPFDVRKPYQYGWMDEGGNWHAYGEYRVQNLYGGYNLYFYPSNDEYDEVFYSSWNEPTSYLHYDKEVHLVLTNIATNVNVVYLKTYYSTNYLRWQPIAISNILSNSQYARYVDYTISMYSNDEIKEYEYGWYGDNDTSAWITYGIYKSGNNLYFEPTDSPTNDYFYSSWTPLYQSPVISGSNVTFYYPDSSYTIVYLAGNMPGFGGDWSSTKKEMSLITNSGGVFWTYTITNVAAGTYQYKFVVNGSDWVQDPVNDNKVDDGFGGYNSVFEIN